MKNDKKEAKFFCECCGSEVPRKSRFCPVCGKFFASVRCPQCGHTGAAENFKKGCPECGYAVNGTPGSSAKNENSGGFLENEKSSSGKKNLKKRKKNNSDSGLPVWTYVISVLILIILIIFLYSCL